MRRCAAKLLAVLAHYGGGWPEPDAHAAVLIHKSAFDGNAPDNIFGGHWP